MSCRAQHKAVELKATNCIDNQAFWKCFSTNVPQHALKMLACFPALQFFKLLLAMQWPVILLFFKFTCLKKNAFCIILQLPNYITLASTTWCITSVSLLAAMSHLERWAPSKQSWHSPQQSPRLSPSPHPRAASHRVPQHSPQRSLSPHPPQGPPQHTPATWRKSRICSRGVVTFWTLRRQMCPVLIAETSRSYLNASSWHRS